MIKVLEKIEENLRGGNAEIFNREDQQKLIMLTTMTEKIIKERDSSLISELHAMILIASSTRGTLFNNLITKFWHYNFWKERIIVSPFSLPFIRFLKGESIWRITNLLH